MFEWTRLATFMLAAGLLIVVPGPAVLYVVARSMDQGKLAGIVSVLGIALGAVVHSLAAAVGITAVLAASALAFSTVKYLGAAYLIYLGITTLLKKPEIQEKIVVEPKPLWQIFRQGFVVNLLNPKTALFFLAFLPQFADPARGSVPLQTFILGLIFVTIALLSDSIYALLAGQLGGWLKQSQSFQQRQRYFSGSVYIALGVATAVSGSKTK
ncbi:MAG: LysE family translocator [Ardenticatenaceae bacterium]|nr:LysE family translocator [Ardenticatenaceae bacterium]MCB8948733.1 LysE family translocator [Ardenticatenaceae bacterium]